MVKRSQRLVALFAAIIILFEVAAVPQKAKAVALTASVIASVAAIMTACGVTYWAASQTDAIEYLGGKIDDYLASLETVPQSYEDWLSINASSELFDVPSSGVMRFGSGIANKVFDFVRWYNHTEGIVSGGSAVTDGGLGIAQINQSQTTNGSVDAAFNGDVITFVFTGYGAPNNYFTTTIPLSVPVGATVTATCVASDLSYNGNNMSSTIRFGVDFTDSPSTLWFYGGADLTSVGHYVSTTRAEGDGEYLALTCNTDWNRYNGTLSFRISGDDVTAAPSASVTPSAAVAVPSNLSDNDSFAVTPNVILTEGMTVDQASEELLDGVASEDGLTAESEVLEPPSLDLSGILEALGSILNAILSIPSHIANGVQSIVTTLGEKVDAFKDAVHGFLTTFDTYLYEIRQRLTEMAHDVTMLISDRLEYLFVPDEVYVQNYVQSIMHLFDGRVGILTFPLSVFVDFLTRFASISDGDHSFHWGNINEPFSGRQVIAAGSYNLDDAVASSPMSTVYSVYLVVVKAVIAFWFLRLCQRKYELIVNAH